MIDKETFYKRQIILKEIGESGQGRLSNSSVLVVGAGGLGHPVASYLAASGVGFITICDYDKVELTNLHRQILFTPEDIGLYKADVLANKIQKQNPLISIKVLREKLSAQNILNEIEDVDIVVDCCDNFSTKFLLHDSAYLYKKDLVQASIYQLEGQLQVFPFKSQGVDKGCLRCLWPKIPKEGCVGSCAQAGVVGAVAGVLGSMQAMEVIKLICRMQEITFNKTKTINLLTMDIDTLGWKKDDCCVLCSDSAVIKNINKNEYERKTEFEIDQIGVAGHRYIDIREIFELSQLEEQIEKTEPVVLFCHKGIRSFDFVTRLRKRGYSNIFSLKGGAPSHV